jgi:hypothetical protein
MGRTIVPNNCDKCGDKVNLPWRIDTSGELTIINRRTEAFNPSVVARTYWDVVGEEDVVIPLPRSPVPFVNLCEQRKSPGEPPGGCWQQESTKWGGGDFSKAAAKAYKQEAVYFNNQRPDYYRGGVPDVATILTNCVHEMSHYWSNEGERSGLTLINGKGASALRFNECVTDYLARKTYFGIQTIIGLGMPYRTNYGHCSEFITRALELCGGPRRQVGPQMAIRHAAFPPPFNSLTGNLNQVNMQPIEKALTHRFVRWYLHGVETKIDGQNADEFLESDQGKFIFGSYINGVVLGYSTFADLLRP